MDRLAGGAAAARADGDRPGSPRSGPRRPVLPVPAVARRAAVAGGARADVQAWSLFGDLPFMVDGDSADVWARQHEFRLDCRDWRAARRVQRDRTELGQSALPVGRHRSRRLSVAARAGPAEPPTLFDGYRIDHLVGFYRTFGVAERRLAALLHRRPTQRRRSRSASGCSACFESQARRSSRRISVRCRISCARRSRASAYPDFACFAGSGIGTRKGSAVPRARRVSGGLGRDIRHARHRTDGDVVGIARRQTTGTRCGR